MDARTAADLELMVRERLDDMGTTRPRWSSKAIRRALSEAEREACVRAGLLHDRTTASIVQLPVAAGRSTLLLHPSVYDVDVVERASDSELVAPMDEQTLRLMDSQWRTAEGSRVEHYVVQMLPSERLQLRLHPIPLIDDVLELQVYRLPLDELEDDDDEPEIAPRHHDALVDFAVYRCLSVRDHDGHDPAAAEKALAMFTDNFGERPDANVQRKQREPRRHLITPRDY